jgi:hypothetical protein
LRVARKHSIIYHGQGVVAEIKEFSSLGGWSWNWTIR